MLAKAASGLEPLDGKAALKRLLTSLLHRVVGHGGANIVARPSWYSSRQTIDLPAAKRHSRARLRTRYETIADLSAERADRRRDGVLLFLVRLHQTV